MSLKDRLKKLVAKVKGEVKLDTAAMERAKKTIEAARRASG